MKKNEVQQFLDAKNKVNCYVKPTKTIDSGSKGKAYEVEMKLFYNGKVLGTQAVSTKGKKDLTINGYTLEIKQGCPTLDNIEKSNFINYSIDGSIEKSRVYKPSTFMNILYDLGLVRIQKMSDGTKVLHMQYFKSSQKKTTALIEMLNANGITAIEFKEWAKSQKSHDMQAYKELNI